MLIVLLEEALQVLLQGTAQPHSRHLHGFHQVFTQGGEFFAKWILREEVLHISNVLEDESFWFLMIVISERKKNMRRSQGAGSVVERKKVCGILWQTSLLDQ